MGSDLASEVLCSIEKESMMQCYRYSHADIHKQEEHFIGLHSASNYNFIQELSLDYWV